MKNFITALLFAWFTLPIYAQQSDSVKVEKDSVTAQLQEYNQFIEQSKRKSIEDSLRKAELMAQIQLLKEHDKLKQAELLGQIQQMEQKDSLHNEERKNRILKMKETAKGFAVAPFEDTLFVIYTKIGPVMPQERAANIARKTDLLYNDDFFQPDSIEIVNNMVTIPSGYLPNDYQAPAFNVNNNNSVIH